MDFKTKAGILLVLGAMISIAISWLAYPEFEKEDSPLFKFVMRPFCVVFPIFTTAVAIFEIIAMKR